MLHLYNIVLCAV